MKSDGDTFWNHLAECIHHLEFLPCPYDPDLWMKPMVRPEDEFKYYACALIYLDDVMVILHDSESVLIRIDKSWYIPNSYAYTPWLTSGFLRERFFARAAERIF